MATANSNSIFGSAVITVVMRWTDRLIGFVSTLILARLLVPDDFGIVAMASIVVGLVDIFLDLGVNVALIQNREATTSHYDTAWTLRLLQAIAAAIVVLGVTPYAADYFNDPRVVSVLQFMSLGLVLAGLENIGVVSFQKEMQFGREFRFLFARRMFGFIVTIAAAWVLLSYWALVIGALAGRAFGVALSYVMHDMRPRISFERFGDIISISMWQLVRNIGLHMDNTLHKMLVGGRDNAATMGAYGLADEIAAMPGSEMLAPLNRALFPAFVQQSDNMPELIRMFLSAQSVQTLIAVPASAGLALVANEMVGLLLGEKWLIAVPFIQVLAIANVVQSIYISGGYVMITLGYSRVIALLSWFQLALFACVAIVLVPDAAALQIACIRVFVVIVGLAVALWLLLRTLKTLTLRDVARSVYRPLAATMIMTIAVLSCGVLLPADTLLLALLLKVAVGIGVYLCAIIVLWLIVGKPAGGESYLLEKVLELAKRRQHAL